MFYYENDRYKNKRVSLFDTVVSKVKNAFVDTNIEKLDIRLKYVDWLRGESFINDFHELFKHKYPEADKLELVELVTLLYVDFIKQIKSGKYSHEAAARFLVDGKKKYLDGLKKQRPTRKEVHQISPNSFIFEDVEDDDDDDDELERDVSVGDIVYVEIDFNKNLNNRCKVFLYDIENFLDGVVVNIEDVIAIRYLNFIDQIRLEGNNPKVMKAILKSYINSKALE